MTTARRIRNVVVAVVGALIATVLVLGTLLLTVAYFSPITHCGDMRRTKAMADIRGIAEALAEFRWKQGLYPTSDEGLFPLVASGYLDRMPVDPWGRGYVYVLSDRSYRLTSLGADGREGGTGQDVDVEESFPIDVRPSLVDQVDTGPPEYRIHERNE